MMNVSSRFVTLCLSLAAIVLVVLSLLRFALESLASSLPFSFEIERMLRFGRESSLSSWFTASVFLFCALLLVVAARAHHPSRNRFFLGLSLLSGLLALDQATDLNARFLALWQAHFTVSPSQGWVLGAIWLLMAWVILKISRLWQPPRFFFRCSFLLILTGYIGKILISFGFTQLDGALAGLFITSGAVLFCYTCLSSFEPPPLEIRFTWGRQVLLWSVVISVFFTLMTILLHVLTFQTDISSYDPFHFLNLFDTGQEATIPTFFSHGLMLLAALLLWLIKVGRERDNRRFMRHWGGLAVLFLFLSLDESVSLHEQLMQPARALLSKLMVQDSGFLYYAWIVPVGILLIILIIVYIPFLRHLPRRTLMWFFLSALLFIGGAIGIEIPGGYFTRNFGSTNSIRLGLEVVEELCELLGVSVFVYALLDYLRTHIQSLPVSFAPQSARSIEEISPVQP